MILVTVKVIQIFHMMDKHKFRSAFLSSDKFFFLCWKIFIKCKCISVFTSRYFKWACNV